MLCIVWLYLTVCPSLGEIWFHTQLWGELFNHLWCLHVAGKGLSNDQSVVHYIIWSYATRVQHVTMILTARGLLCLTRNHQHGIKSSWPNVTYLFDGTVTWLFRCVKQSHLITGQTVSWLKCRRLLKCGVIIYPVIVQCCVLQCLLPLCDSCYAFPPDKENPCNKKQCGYGADCVVSMDGLTARCQVSHHATYWSVSPVHCWCQWRNTVLSILHFLKNVIF